MATRTITHYAHTTDGMGHYADDTAHAHRTGYTTRAGAQRWADTHPAADGRVWDIRDGGVVGTYTVWCIAADTTPAPMVTRYGVVITDVDAAHAYVGTADGMGHGRPIVRTYNAPTVPANEMTPAHTDDGVDTDAYGPSIAHAYGTDAVRDVPRNTTVVDPDPCDITTPHTHMASRVVHTDAPTPTAPNAAPSVNADHVWRVCGTRGTADVVAYTMDTAARTARPIVGTVNTVYPPRSFDYTDGGPAYTDAASVLPHTNVDGTSAMDTYGTFPMATTDAPTPGTRGGVATFPAGTRIHYTYDDIDGPTTVVGVTTRPTGMAMLGNAGILVTTDDGNTIAINRYAIVTVLAPRCTYPVPTSVVPVGRGGIVASFRANNATPNAIAWMGTIAPYGDAHVDADRYGNTYRLDVTNVHGVRYVDVHVMGPVPDIDHMGDDAYHTPTDMGCTYGPVPPATMYVNRGTGRTTIDDDMIAIACAAVGTDPQSADDTEIAMAYTMWVRDMVTPINADPRTAAMPTVAASAVHVADYIALPYGTTYRVTDAGDYGTDGSLTTGHAYTVGADDDGVINGTVVGVTDMPGHVDITIDDAIGVTWSFTIAAVAPIYRTYASATPAAR